MGLWRGVGKRTELHRPRHQAQPDLRYLLSLLSFVGGEGTVDQVPGVSDLLRFEHVLTLTARKVQQLRSGTFNVDKQVWLPI